MWPTEPPKGQWVNSRGPWYLAFSFLNTDNKL
jgi:hypothetical protein